MWLTLLLALPLLGAVAVVLLPAVEEQQSRYVGLFFAVCTTLVSWGLLSYFEPSSSSMQFAFQLPWIKALGISYHVGVDGISLWLVLLTTLLVPLVLLTAPSSITKKTKEFVASILLLELGLLGALVALDLFLFYVFWELMLIPMYLVIGIWGHERKVYAAIKFVIYTMVGSLLMLVAIIYMVVTHGQATGIYTFDYTILSHSIWGQETQLWLFAAFAFAFAIKVPLFPLHTWLPDAHVEAPTGGSVLLAGVLLKLGAYGLLRFAIPLFPWAAAAFAPYLSLLAIIGIIYGALVAYAQKDAKKLIAYSSVSHLGFIVLGLMAMNEPGIMGSILQMCNHGLSTSGLFLAIGVLYDRRHTRLLAQYGGLWKQLPVFAGIFMILILSSLGLPGLNGFVGEFLILLGSFNHHQLNSASGLPIFIYHSRLMTALATTGVILGAVYLLHLFQKLMFGPITQPANRELPDLNRRELVAFLPLVLLVFILGIYPRPLLVRMEPTVNQYLKEYQQKYGASMAYQGTLPKPLVELLPNPSRQFGALTFRPKERP